MLCDSPLSIFEVFSLSRVYVVEQVQELHWSKAQHLHRLITEMAAINVEWNCQGCHDMCQVCMSIYISNLFLIVDFNGLVY